MLVTEGVLAAALVVVGFAAWRLLCNRSISSAQSTAIVVVATWVTASAVLWWGRHGDVPSSSAQFPSRAELVRSLESLGRLEAPPAPAGAAATAAMQAGSVESLVGGLEARLAEQPNDANGWALLAQSYAYTSNRDAAERALQRAVALGLDEQALRNRVASAHRSAPVGDWFDRVMPPKRP